VEFTGREVYDLDVPSGCSDKVLCLQIIVVDAKSMQFSDNLKNRHPITTSVCRDDKESSATNLSPRERLDHSSLLSDFPSQSIINANVYHVSNSP
jgi:hypothetical protein